VGKGHLDRLRQVLKGVNISVSKAIASPFRRSMETAELLMECCGGGSLKASPALVPGAGVDDLLKAIANNHSDLKDDEWVLAVCHEPDVSYILARLTMGQDHFPFSVLPGDIFALNVRIDHQVAEADIVASFSPVKVG
jgi:phosphohistidine phosphatase SixA